jgi:phenylpropionate dioxygenase-like ring-hydroxylating dioxygenase large terminal subunit
LLHAGAEYPQAWYPLVRSDELPRGKALGVHAFSDELVAWRGRDGQAAVMARHCAHMGADLARAMVSGNDLVCPLHRLHIDLSGRGRFSVASIPAPGPCQSALPVAERYGIVFVYLGARPHGELPWPDSAPPHYCSRPFARAFETSFDVVCLNNFDRDHFNTVHGRELDSYSVDKLGDGDLRASFQSRIAGTSFADKVMRAVGIREVGIEVDIHGANLAMMRNPRTGAGALIATLPVEQWHSRLFVVTFGGRRKGMTGVLTGRARFALQSWLVMHFLKQDMRALDGMRVRLDAALLAGDGVLRLWDEHCRALPRTSLARLQGREARSGQLSVVGSKASG